MPGENIQDWSVTAANNGTADSLINFAEGQTRASMNDSARSLMAGVAKWRNLLNGSITTGGSANAQTFTSGISYTSVPTGIVVRLKIGSTNTGGATLNMDGIGFVGVLTMAGTALVGGELAAGAYVDLIYNGTNWILLNSVAASNYVSGTVLVGAKLALTSNVAANLQSISLPVGVWEVAANTFFQTDSGASSTLVRASISLVSATEDIGTPDRFSTWPGMSASEDRSFSIPRYRLTVTSTTTVYHVVVTLSSGNVFAYGHISARRV